MCSPVLLTGEENLMMDRQPDLMLTETDVIDFETKDHPVLISDS